MLQFDAAPIVTSNPFSVNGKQFLSRNREMLGECATGGRGIVRAPARAGASKQNVRLAAPCDRAFPHHDHERGTQLGRPIMRKLITTIALLALVDTSLAIAQPAGSPNPAAPPSTNSGQQLLPE